MRNDKIHRITFSRSLCEHIAKLSPVYSIKRIKFSTGKAIGPDDTSRSGLYAICKPDSGWPLRITFFKELAELWRDTNRDVRECFVTEVKDYGTDDNRPAALGNSCTDS